MRRIGNSGLHGDDFTDEGRADERTLQLGDRRADHPQRVAQQQDVGVRLDQGTDRDRALLHQGRAVPERAHEPDGRQEIEERKVGGTQPGQPHGGVEDPGRPGLQCRQGGLLRAEALDRGHAGERLADLGRRRRQFPLDGLRLRAEAPGESHRDHQDENTGAQAHQHERDADQRKQCDRAKQHHQPGEEQRDHDERLLDLEQVGAGTRDEDTAGDLRVKAQVQAVGVPHQPGADVPLDQKSQALRPPPAQRGRECPGRADRGDDETVADHRADAVIGDAGVDRVGDQSGDCQLACAPQNSRRQPQRADAPVRPDSEPKDFPPQPAGVRTLREPGLPTWGAHAVSAASSARSRARTFRSMGVPRSVGAEPTSKRVYGCCGSLTSSDVGRYSTIRPW